MFEFACSEAEVVAGGFEPSDCLTPSAGGTSFVGLISGAVVAPASSPASVEKDVAVRYNAVCKAEAGAFHAPNSPHAQAPMSGMRGLIKGA